MDLKTNRSRRWSIVAGAAVITLITALGTFLLTRALFGNLCESQKLTFSEHPEWDMVNRLEIPDRGLTVTRLVSSDRCYIMPIGTGPEEKDQGRPLVLIDEPLGFETIEHLAGSDAAAFCRSFQTYMLRELKAEEMEHDAPRPKRQGYGAPPPAPSGGYQATAAPAPPPAAGTPAPPAYQPPPATSAPAPPPAPVATAAPAPPPAPAYTSAPAPPPAPATSAPAPPPAPATSAPAPPPAPAPATSAPAPPPAPATSAPGGYGAGAAGGSSGGASGGASGGGAPLSTAELAAKVPELTGQRVQGEGIFGGAVPPSGIVADIPLEQRQPRCHKIVLDCVNMVGQVQSCFTWQNGRIWMDRKCLEPNKFVIRMTKPPGRILKVAQQESILCLQRHKEGKDC